MAEMTVTMPDPVRQRSRAAQTHRSLIIGFAMKPEIMETILRRQRQFVELNS